MIDKKTNLVLHNKVVYRFSRGPSISSPTNPDRRPSSKSVQSVWHFYLTWRRRPGEP